MGYLSWLEHNKMRSCAKSIVLLTLIAVACSKYEIPTCGGGSKMAATGEVRHQQLRYSAWGNKYAMGRRWVLLWPRKQRRRKFVGSDFFASTAAEIYFPDFCAFLRFFRMSSENFAPAGASRGWENSLPKNREKIFHPCFHTP